MRRLRALFVRCIGWLSRRRSERELSAELESHLQMHIDDNLASGMTPVEARRHALMALGGVDATKEAYRDQRGLPRLEALLRDLRYGARSLRKSPGFALAGIAILGLGIGANSAIFTIVNAVVLRPLPFADSNRIMRLWHTPPPGQFPGSPVFALSPANFLDWEAQSRTFEAMAMYREGRRTLTGQGEPDAVHTIRASASFFPILGVAPTLGRGFSKDDDRAGAPPSALLSETFWRSRFGADPSVVGRSILLDRTPHTVIGIVPAPSFLEDVQVWMPLLWTADDRATRNNHNYRGVAKLKPGVDVAQAQADLDTISSHLAQAYPADDKDWGALVLPLGDDLVADARLSLLVLLGAVALVLLIACANLANLILVRTHGRAKEIAVRGALGASRARVVQQLLAEGALLGIGGGLAGLFAAYYGIHVLVTALGSALPRASEVALDGTVLAFTAAISMATGLVAAFAPAWQLTGRDANEGLKQGPGRGNSSTGDGRIRNLLVTCEVALALMLLVGAGLLMRSLSSVRAVDPGFDPRHVLTARVNLSELKYTSPEQRNQFFDRTLRALRALPGVEAAASVDSVPLRGGSSQYVAVEGARPVQESELPVVAVRLPSPGYFTTLRIPLVRGRAFTDADTFGAPPVAILSELTARRFWPNEDPIGKHVTLPMMSKAPREVVGIVREVKMGSLDAGASDSETAVYAPAAQFAFGGATLVVRTTLAPETVERSIIGAVRAIDPEQPLLDLQTLEQVVEKSLGQRPFAMMLMATFAGLALLLASIGIYSVLAFAVRQRVREIGIRLALGAPIRGVLGMILFEGLKPTLAGVALGLVLAAALVRVMAALLFNVSQYDPATFALVAALVTAIGIAATLIPAYRATHVDPIVTLRAE